MQNQSEQHELQELASLARRSIEPGLLGNGSDGPKSAGACLHACLVVVMLVKQFGRGIPVVRGGSDGAGALDSSGKWCGHYWVEIQMPSSSKFVMDITADQFGYAPIVVMPLNAASLRYCKGPQTEVDEAFAELVAEFCCKDLALA